MQPSMDQVRQELADLTRALVDIPSVSRNEAAVTRFIRDTLPPALPIVLDDDDVVFVTTPRRPGMPLVTLAGHTDTVPIDANIPSVASGDTIFGRGASDMKSGVAVMLRLAMWFSDHLPLDFDLGFIFFPREEIGADENALLPAIEKCTELRDTRFAILMEPTANALEAGCVGNLQLELHFAGEAAHSARPWMGTNAAHLAITALHDLALAAPVDVVVDGLTFREVASVTGIRGGLAKNVIPPETVVDVNVRYAPSRMPSEVERFWRERFADTAGQVHVISNAAAAPVVVNDPFAQRLLDAGAHAPVPKQAWTNAADFAAHDIPAINFGPGDPFYAHRQDEQVSIEALLHSFNVLRRFTAGMPL